MKTMIAIQGFMIGSLYSFAAISTAILTLREIINGNFMTGIYASFGTMFAQLIYAGVAVIATINSKLFAQYLSWESSKISIITSALVMVYIAYHIYKTSKPESSIVQDNTKGFKAVLTMLSINQDP